VPAWTFSSSFFKCAKTVFDENSLIHIAHPRCSPGLASSNFWVFGHIKTSLADCAFNDANVLLEAVIGFLNEIQPPGLQHVFTTGSNE
jgi:hypothetical protein